MFIVLILAASVPAGEIMPIEVENFSFKLPGTVKQHCWDGERPKGGVFADDPGWTDGPSASNDSSVDLSSIYKITIGVGQIDGRVGAGKLYFDNFRLYPVDE